MGAEKYKWEITEAENHLKWEQNDPTATYYPKGEVVLMNKTVNSQLVLAYRFSIYAEKPLSKKEVYVNAETGDILWEENKLYHADETGTANTGYSGTQTMTSDSLSSGNYRLRETGRGNGIRTFDCNNGASLTNTDFINNSKNWTAFSPIIDQYATDAHWGAEATYDYFLNEHGRNSVDNNGFQLNSYVHYDDNFSNAFWDGFRMVYGDGAGNNSPYQALDVAGHEMTHGVTSNSADLIYSSESGALNESFSDIFGACVEFTARPSQANWLIAEDLIGVPTFRNMANPNALGDPDTYFGTFWASLTGGDNGGVHTNSGVQNYWFVLLTDGGSGTNDNGDTYSVSGIGLSDAGKVAYRNLTTYLTPSSQFADARFFAIQSTIDLFGNCTSELEAVTNAWYAVGVGPAYLPVAISDFSASATNSCSMPFSVSFTNKSFNGINFSWDFGDGGTSTQANPSHTYLSQGTYSVELIADGGVTCGIDTLKKNALITIDTAFTCVNLPLSGTGTTRTECSGVLYDSGGPSGNYSAFQDSRVTISPSGATTIDLSFVAFDIEPGDQGPTSCNFDYLTIYDGPNTSSPTIGVYCNNNIPTTIESSGNAVTIELHSDGGLELAGFEMTWSCKAISPIADFTVDVDTTCAGSVNFTDLSTNGPTSWNWDFGDGSTSSDKNPFYTYTANGLYEVTLISTNLTGNDTVKKTNFIFVNSPLNPVGDGDSICANNNANLSATGVGTLKWYDSPTGGTLLKTGANYLTPTLTGSTDYYVEDAVTAPIKKMGKPDNSGGGANYNSSQHLVFDVYTEITIVDVKVYAQGTAFRTIQLRNSAGTVLDSKSVLIINGLRTVTLNFNVAPGNNYQLGVSGANFNMYRNNVGVNYPYDLAGIASITKSSASVNGGLDHYYFFYDWNVREADCVSGRTQVTATVNNCTGIEDLEGNTEITSYINHTNNTLELGLINLDKGNYSLMVINALGEIVISNRMLIYTSQENKSINLNSLAKGVYYIRLSNASSSYSDKFVR